MIVVLSGPSAGAASTTCGGSAADGNAVAAEPDGATGAVVVTAASALAAADVVGLTAGAIAKVGATAIDDEPSAAPAGADEGVAAAVVGALATDVVG